MMEPLSKIFFILKKILPRFFFPVPLCLEILLIGLALLWLTRRQMLGKILITSGTVLLLFFGYPWLGQTMLMPLERQYAALENPDSLNKALNHDSTAVRYVVVLGGSHVTDPGIPLLSQIEKGSLTRLAEGVRLYRKLPQAKLVLSGGPGADPVSNAEVMQKIALELGVSEKDMILETKSRDTHDEVVFMKDLIGQAPFILVTSASHMPRSMRMFKKAGMHPIPAVTDHQVKEKEKFRTESLFPNATNVSRAESAIYEYFGFVLAKIKGNI